ncbi:MAG TPA: hypothetical protein VGL66_03780 [Caulobacteraceae bacterium]|jgi:hypothetical protein
MARSPATTELRNDSPFDLMGPQQTKLAALKQFRDLLSQPELQDATRRDGNLFSNLLTLAFESYGVQQARMTEVLHLSTGVLSRWARGANLPSSALRPVVIRTIVEEMNPSIKAQEKKALPLGLVH